MDNDVLGYTIGIETMRSEWHIDLRNSTIRGVVSTDPTFLLSLR